MFRLFENNITAILVFVFMCWALAMSSTRVRAAEVTSPLLSFSVPLKDETPNISRNGTIGSAFLVSYRNKVFLLTNAHVVLNAGITHQFAFRDGENWVALQARWTFTTIDVVAIDVTSLVSPEKAGRLRLGTGDLVPRKTAITVLCNPDNFSRPFIGVYNGIDAEKEIELKFTGPELASGCSGAPALDSTGNIRGIIFGRIPGDPANQVGWGYAISSDEIARFLDEKFFK